MVFKSIIQHGVGPGTILNQVILQDYYEVSTNVTATNPTTNLNLTNGNIFIMSQAVDTTLTFSNPGTAPLVSSMTLVRIKDNTATPRVITWPVSVLWGNNGTPPIISTNANAIDVFTFMTYDNGTSWLGFNPALDMA